jgi:tetratricopeptide (TPR) repeat protein
MFNSALQSRLSLVVLIPLMFALAACGGAESRKARHLEKGDGYLATENYEKARVEFRNALQITPNDSLVRYKNGVVDERLGNPREAAQFYQGAIESNADNIQARAALGHLFVFGGAPDRALETIKPGLEKHPDDASLLVVRAAARIQLKDKEGALPDAERAVGIAPASEDAVAVLAGIYKSLDNTEKARAVLEQGIKRIPASVDLRLALAQLYGSLGQDPQVEALLLDLVRLKPQEKSHRIRLAQFYARLSHVDEAEHVLREAIKAIPDELSLKVALIDFLAVRRGRDEAAKELNSMIAASPKDYDIRLLQAQFAEQNKDFAQAQGIYESIIAKAHLDAAGITARNRLAVLKVQLKDMAGAQKLLSEVLANNPRDNDALVIRGNLALAQKDPKTAIADLRSVLRDQPNAAGVMRSLARAHLANGEPALAEETMRRAVDANPRDSAVRLDLAQLLMQLGKPEQAKPIIDELVKQQPDDMIALETAFQVDAAIGDKPSALAAANAMVAAHPDDSLGYFNQGAAAEADKRFEDALRLYAKASEIKPEASEPMEGAARVLARTNRAPEALKHLDEIAAKFPKLPTPCNIKGELLLSMNRPVEAQVAFAAAIEREPRWWVPYRGLSASQLAQGQDAAALATLQSAIAKVSQPEGLDLVLAGMFERQGKIDDAIGLYDKVLLLNPQADVAANNLAMTLITHRKDGASLDRANTLAARFSGSTNPAFLDTYGWVLFKRGDNAGALAALQSAVARTPDSPVLSYHLGMAQAKAGQLDAARTSLGRSLKSGREFQGIDEARATLNSLASQTASIASAPKS